MDEAKLARVSAEEKLVTVRTEVLKKREPMKFIVYVLIGLISIGLVVLGGIWINKLIKN